MMNRLLFFGIFTTLSAFGQQLTEKESDTLKIDRLEEVVITGQINSQSVKKSVFEVRVISRKDIENQAANNLADILNQNLNMTIIPNASTGKSQIQLFGLDGQYFKVLVDNIPLINDEGLGNNTDLTQINLDDIEQIEIVEGSMGVQYGSNAVSGIINIITKKSSRYRWEITPYIQEETIGSEYNLKNRGRHIQSIKIGHNFSEKIYANALFTRNDFMGFFGKMKGVHYTENDGLRGYEWLPKEQLNGKALVYFNFKNLDLHYKMEYFNEDVYRYNNAVNLNYNPATQTTSPTALDDIFSSVRWYNHLNAFGQIAGKVKYDLSVAYQQQKRSIETFTYRIDSRKKENVQNDEYESRKGLYSKGSFSNFFSSEAVRFQLGYELSIIDGYASTLAGTFSEQVDRRMENYDIYASSEYLATERLSFQPGVRLLLSPQFSSLWAASLSSKYVFNESTEARLIAGSSPRTPNYEELYTYFVDINHDVQGNENLAPEKGYSVFGHLKKSVLLHNNLQWNPKLSAWYLSVQDRIELVVVNNLPLQYKFENIDRYKTWGLSLTNSVIYTQLQANAGITINGVSKILDSRTEMNDDFLYTVQFNANVSYTLPRYHLIFSVYYKYNGSQYQYVQKQDQNNETIVFKGKQDGFSWVDASAKKSFWNKRIELTLGVRNLLNIERINTTATEGGAHSAPPTNIMLGYGRSYFIKLLYNLNF